MTEYPDFHGDMPISHANLKDAKKTCACGTQCSCGNNCDCNTCGCEKCSKEKCACGGNCKCNK